jgi:Fic family protein
LPDFEHKEFTLIEPEFGSSLVDLIIELDHLRRKQLQGSTHPQVFFQLKRIFHMLESVGSARIEGNNTTMAEYIETKIDERPYINENIQEIRNIESAMDFIDENIQESPINRFFISELHKTIVKDLTPPPEGEGDSHPGKYRSKPISIQGVNHTPPSSQQQIEGYMDELIDVVNRDLEPKYDLIRIAMVHHRFMWIHPFNNGNGRTGRLLTYAMLVKAGFNVNVGRILNPTAVFCFDRELYYDMLAKADSGENEDLEEWCYYVLDGLKTEIDKVDRLLDYEYLKEEILIPALDYSIKLKYIDKTDYKILKKAVEEQVIQNSDLQEIFIDKLPAAISRMIRKLRENKMLEPEPDNSRKYHISVTNNFLIRGVIKKLEEKGFIPLQEEMQEA